VHCCVERVSGVPNHTVMDSEDLSRDRTMPQVMVISSEGYFYCYNIDLENGGECTLQKQFRWARSILLRTKGWLMDISIQLA
jgi:hypothetical protein